MGSSLPLSHRMLLLANPSREGEALPAADTLAGICSACRWVKRGECCFLSALMAFPDEWGCSHHPASDSRAPSCLGTWDWGNPSALWALPQCPAHRGAAVLQEHSCLQQDSLGSAACQIPWLPRGCDTAPIAFSPARQREHKAPSVPGL